MSNGVGRSDTQRDDSYSFIKHWLGFHLDLKVTRPLASMPVPILWEREHELSFHLAVSI
jgi:hypothetical protein